MINMAFMPCKDEIFCYDCRVILENANIDKCPLCEEKIDMFVKVYSVEQALADRR